MKKLLSHALFRPPGVQRVLDVSVCSNGKVFFIQGIGEVSKKQIWRGRAVEIDMGRDFRKGVEMCRSAGDDRWP